MSKLLVADITNEKLRRDLGGAEFAFPVTPHKSTQRIGLRFSRQHGDRHIAAYPKIRELRATVGQVDLRPEAGQVSFQVGEDPPVEDENVTALLSYDFSAEDLQTALNNLTDASDVEVVEDDESFLITGLGDSLKAYRNTLRPMCFARVHSYQVDGETTYAVRLQRAPLAFTDQFTQIVPEAPYIERLEAGGTEGDIEYPEIQQLTIPLDFAGSFQIRTADGSQKSKLLGVADGPEEIAAAINPDGEGGIGLASDENGIFTVTEHPTEPAAIIEFGGSMVGVAHDPLTVHVFSAPPGDWWCDLVFDTAAMAEAFREVDRLRVPIEFFADIEDDDDENLVRENIPIYRGEIVIVESISHDDLGTASNIDYREPPAAKSYQPQSPDALSSGVRFYPFLIGDGADTGPFSIPHDLASPRTGVFLRENVASGKQLVNGTDYRVDFTDDNTAQSLCWGPTPQRLQLRMRYLEP